MNTILRTRQPHDWWNTVALGVVAVISVFVMIWFSACSSGSPRGAKTNTTATPVSTAVTKTENVPASLANAGEYGENVYDYAKANDWKNAGVKIAALKDAIKQVRTDVENQRAAVGHL